MRAQKNIPEQLKLSDFADKSLLILDDDDPLRGRLARAMEKKGFQIKEAKTVAEGLAIVKKSPPGFACVDLRLEDGNGLVESALLASPESKANHPENPMSADRVKWEHIHRVFELCNRNVSETARRLKNA